MLSVQDIRNLAYKDELQNRDGVPLYIWVTGPLATGKTFVIDQLSMELQKSGKVKVYWEYIQVIKEVNADRNNSHHIMHEDGFVLLDNFFHDKMLENLMEEAEAFDGDFFLIELARTGKDYQGIRDLSYRQMSKFITGKILARSIFIRVDCPYKERIKRNEFRNGQTEDGRYRKVPAYVMETFSPDDDFHEWAKSIDRPILVLDNS